MPKASVHLPCLFVNFQADEDVFQVVFGFVPTGRVPAHPKAPSFRIEKYHTHPDSILKHSVMRSLEDVWLVPGKAYQNRTCTPFTSCNSIIVFIPIYC